VHPDKLMVKKYREMGRTRQGAGKAEIERTSRIRHDTGEISWVESRISRFMPVDRRIPRSTGINREIQGCPLSSRLDQIAPTTREALINSSSPRRRGSSTLFLMDSRLRGNDKIDLISSSQDARHLLSIGDKGG
jgi:hypothetical protein